MTKLFFLGATGYIGGSVLDLIAVTYPSLEITIMARSAEKGALVIARYPAIKVVIGDLDSTDLIVAQSALADIVINTANCDHHESVKATSRGLEEGGGGYLIHTSGIGLVWDKPNGSVLNEKIWDDIADLEELSSFPIEAMHRPAEKTVLEAPASVHTVIISPGKVYGIGTGPVKKFTTPFLASSIIENGGGFTMGTGATTMGAVHVADLARLYLLIFGEALKPNGGAADWDAEGYYFAETGEISSAQHVKVVAAELAKLGHIKNGEVEVHSIERVAKMNAFLPIAFGSNARVRASRAKKLGWKPVEADVLDSLVQDIRAEFPAGQSVKHWEFATGLVKSS